MEATDPNNEDLDELKQLIKQIEQLEEFNPMLGHRGCRLGITYPEIYEMQAKAIFYATAKVKGEGIEVISEIMVPLVIHKKELLILRKRIEEVARIVQEETNKDIT